MTSKTPDGFRAVRYCDSQRIYYVTEQAEDGWFKATSDDGKVKLLVDPKAFAVRGQAHVHRVVGGQE